MIELAAVFLCAFAATFISMPILIRKLKAAGMVGKDMNKPGKPEAVEMGGLGVLVGLLAALLLAIGLQTFGNLEFNLINVLAALVTMLIIALIGIFDDLFEIPQALKAFLPLLAATPLVAVMAAGSTAMHLPFIGIVDFGIWYVVLLIPLAIAVCSNLTNMLAGFNGLESGMGIIMFATMAFVAMMNGSIELALISIAMLGSLLAFINFNWSPARAFMGDIGTLSIGTALATSVIIGNLESAGAILVIPFVIDFFIKAANGFPKTFGELRGRKLYPPGGKVKGLVHLVMKLANGITEVNLVLVLLALESVFAIIVILLYGRLFG